MTETTRTWVFVAVAAVSIAVAWVARPPADITPDELIAANLGKEFFPDFKDPTKPTSIQVVSFDEGKAASRIFAVEFADGLWRIPSHHNYPADGADRLARTSTSLIGLKREEYVPRGDLRHDEFGVVDPLDPDNTKLKGRGQRVTLRTKDTVALDLIIGKEVKGRSGFKYLRHPEEKNVYVAKVGLDLSTKFADWVETDLLKLTRDEVIDVVLDNYTVNQAPNGMGEPVPGEVNHLSREKAFDPWKLDGIDPETEEVDATKANDIINTLDDLRLTGVRPKPPGVNADLTIDRSVVKAQAQLNALVQDLVVRGFVPAPGKAEDDPPRLYGKQGELVAKSNKGIIYTLRFGEVFTGDEMEIETGESSQKQAAEDKKEGGDDANSGKNSDAGKQSSRYLLVSVAFDEESLGPKPVKPEPPPGVTDDDEEEEPAGGKSKKRGSAKSGSKKTGNKASKPANSPEKPIEECGPAAPASPDEAAPPEDAAPEASIEDQAQTAKETNEEQKPAPAEENSDTEPSSNKAEPAKEAADGEGKKDEEKPKEKSQDELKKEYEASKKKYKDDLKAWKEKFDAGEKKVKELNTRFGAWYYVISADSFNKLHLSRKDLVKEKTKAEGDKKDDAGRGDPPSNSDEPQSEPVDADAPSEDKEKPAPEPEASDKPSADERTETP
jgi:hypothetical protein